MITNQSTTENEKAEWARYWPYAVAGFIGPIVSSAMTRWIPLHFAVGGTMFVVFTVATWLFQRTSVCPNRRGPWVSIVSGLAAGIAGGLLAFLFPWRQ